MLKKIISSGILLTLIGSQITWAGTVTLFDWGFNINGSSMVAMDGYNPSQIPGIDISGFDQLTGLGNISITYKPDREDNFFVASFFDLEIDESLNTFFNEQGSISGDIPSGLTWEIDDPYNNDIYSNLVNYSLGSGFDNMIFNEDPKDPNFSLINNDVSVGFGWNFFLNTSDYATFTYSMSETEPDKGFYLSQIDPDSKNNVYFTTSMNIVRSNPDPNPVAEPTCFEMLIAGLGILGLFSIMKRKVFYI